MNNFYKSFVDNIIYDYKVLYKRMALIPSYVCKVVKHNKDGSKVTKEIDLTLPEIKVDSLFFRNADVASM
jgi:hypothetical protein